MSMFALIVISNMCLLGLIVGTVVMSYRTQQDLCETVRQMSDANLTMTQTMAEMTKIMESLNRSLIEHFPDPEPPPAVPVRPAASNDDAAAGESCQRAA